MSVTSLARSAWSILDEVLQTGATVKAQVIEFDRSKRRIRLGMKQLEPTSTDHYLAEHQVGETVTGRVVEVKGDRIKVELGDGVFGTCKLVSTETQETRGAANSHPVDVSAVTAMLAAKWKGGGQGDPAAKIQKRMPSRLWQIRTFKISSLDPQQKRIQLEVATSEHGMRFCCGSRFEILNVRICPALIGVLFRKSCCPDRLARRLSTSPPASR